MIKYGLKYILDTFDDEIENEDIDQILAKAQPYEEKQGQKEDKNEDESFYVFEGVDYKENEAALAVLAEKGEENSQEVSEGIPLAKERKSLTQVKEDQAKKKDERKKKLVSKNSFHLTLFRHTVGKERIHLSRYRP